jgi:hypothetical protein
MTTLDGRPTVSRARRVGWLLLHGFALLLLLGAVALVIAPIFMDASAHGVHDWDQMEAHRYLAVKTLTRFHQLPFWDPYTCGGHTWWGGLESGTNLVSPWFPAYLLLSLPHAVRLEIVGGTLLGAVGTWVFASRFTKSPALRLIASVAFALNSRFALQVAAGHIWHLYYAWTPWALFFLDRAIGMAPSVKRPRELREVVLLGATLAMMVYTGAIYPLPQTITVIAFYAVVCAVILGSWRPIGLAVGGGLLSFAFSAPRLLPVLDMLRRYPRLVDSPATLDLTGFVGVFTSKEGHHPPVGPWGYHEWGIYVGWLPFLAMLFALVYAARARERALRLAGGLCLLLGFGRFDVHSPWALAHDWIPIFASQHVPSRWLYPATLLLIVAAVAIFERRLVRQARRGLLELALVFVAAFVALDIGLEAQRPFVGAFTRHLPAGLADSTGPFHQEKVAPRNLQFDVPDWAPIALPEMIANVGVIDCDTFPGLNTYYRDRQGHLPGLGARGRGDADYRGEVFFDSGSGAAMIEKWSPNAVVVHYSGAKPGDTLVMNQNWDAGWRADWRATFPVADRIGARVTQSSGEVTFRYVPRFLVLGILLFLATVAGLVFVWRARAGHSGRMTTGVTPPAK